MARAIWKGAISFGLVHIPVAVISATASQKVDFDWLDSRSMEPVGYRRINKITGKEVTKEHIVKGVQYEKNHYVVLTEDEIRIAHPKSTQTMDIVSFLAVADIPLAYINTPYYLTAEKRGEKVYALLRETLASTGKAALVTLVLHTRQHLAALIPLDTVLTLIVLRWPSEVKAVDIVALDNAATHAVLTEVEKDMAKRLVEGMSTGWNPAQYRDSFHDKIMALVEQKAKQGGIEKVEKSIEEEEQSGLDMVDLSELLRRSLRLKGDQEVTSTTARKVKNVVKNVVNKGVKKMPSTSVKEKASSKKKDKPSRTPILKKTKASLPRPA